MESDSLLHPVPDSAIADPCGLNLYHILPAYPGNLAERSTRQRRAGGGTWAVRGRRAERHIRGPRQRTPTLYIV